MTRSQRQALKDAAQWYARLCSGNAGPADEAALHHWLQQHSLHRWAWGRVDQLQHRLEQAQGITSGRLAIDTLERGDRYHAMSRRSLLKGIVVTGGAATLGWAGYRSPLVTPLLADHHTGIGEIQQLTLDDGSQVTLNTASAIDIAFTTGQRRLYLREGEILVQTAKDPNRPFIVETDNGQIRALGTRFSVREQAEHTRVSVYEHRVEITSRQGQRQIFGSGEAARFTPSAIAVTVPASETWSTGILLADNMPLDSFANELSRYRPGILRCDPALAQHRISGAFRLNNTDQALQAIARSFPVQVTYRSRYWVSIQAQ